MKYTFPSDYSERKCYLVAINASLLPLIGGHLKHFEHRGSWASAEDWEQGYNAFAEIQACLMKCCIDDLIESNNRLYRMLDTAIYGREYSIESTDPLVVTPEIAAARPLLYEDDRSLLGRMQMLQERLDNAFDGTATGHYTRPRGIRDLLEELVTAAEAESNLDPEMLARLIEIVGLLV